MRVFRFILLLGLCGGCGGIRSGNPVSQVIEALSSSPTPTPTPIPTATPGAVEIPPAAYFRFETASNLGLPSVGQASLDFAYFSPQMSAGTSGPVGGYLQCSGGLVQGPASLPASTAALNGVAIEFLFKPGSDFGRKRKDKFISIGPVSTAISPESIQFATPGDTFEIPFDGIGPKSLSFYLDGQWHHLVFQFDGKSGLKQVWVDGVLPEGFSKTVAPVASVFSASTKIEIGTTTDYDMFRGSMDELAIYGRALPPALIVGHEAQWRVGKPYGFMHEPGLALPPAPAVGGVLDAKEFAPGTVLPTSATAVAQGVSVSALDQLKRFPSPRLKAGALPRNPSYFAWDYLGNLQYNSASVANQIGGQIYTEMADRWNYYLTHRVDYATAANFANVNRGEYHLRQVSLARPDLPFWGLTLRVQNGAAQRRQDLPDACYVRDSTGAPVIIATRKRIRPFSSSAAATTAGCPDSNYDSDATYVSAGFNATLASTGLHASTVFAGFSDNNEFLYPAASAVAKDPSIASDYQAAGSPGYLQYDSNHFGRLDARFRDLVKGSNARLANAIFQSYQVDTDQGYYWEWSNFRQSFTPWNGYLLATSDFYPRFPNNWRDGYGAWHGLSWMMKARRYQIDKGDSLFSPYTAAGWDADEGKNIRPAQWLGLQKIIHGLGAPYTLPGIYIEAAPWPKAEAYIHQVATPIYAQAAFSQVQDLLLNGQLLDGDVPLNPTDSVSARKGYEFWAGDPRIKVIVRKLNSSAVYLIVSTLQPLSSIPGNTELSKVAQITLAGQALRFEVRRQGSIYVWDARNSANPLFYQVDGWHEASHPYYWSSQTSIEAELAESGLSGTAPELKTERASGSTGTGDFVNSRTYVSFPATQTIFGSGLKYSYRPVDSIARTVYVLARSKVTGGTGKLSLSADSGAPVSSSTISGTTWAWVAVNLPALNSPAPHTLTMLPSSAQVEIDRILITDTAP